MSREILYEYKCDFCPEKEVSTSLPLAWRTGTSRGYGLEPREVHACLNCTSNLARL